MAFIESVYSGIKILRDAHARKLKSHAEAVKSLKEGDHEPMEPSDVTVDTDLGPSSMMVEGLTTDDLTKKELRELDNMGWRHIRGDETTPDQFVRSL